MGRGRVSITAACQIADGVKCDHDIPHRAIQAFASLGAEGRHPQNFERDLHRWLRHVFGLELEVYSIELDLQVDSLTARPRSVAVLLPHEVIHAIFSADSGCPGFIFKSLFLGNLDDASRLRFWNHILTLSPWQDHPVINSGIPLEKLIGLNIHADGAVMKRDDECFVWSFSSCFGEESVIKDPLLQKFPVAIVPERHMLSKTVSRLLYVSVASQGWFISCFLQGLQGVHQYLNPHGPRPLAGPRRGQQKDCWAHGVVVRLRKHWRSTCPWFLWWAISSKHC